MRLGLVWLGAVVAAWLAVVAPARAVEVKVGLYVLSLGKLDLERALVPADFYATFACSGPCPALDFEIMNGRIVSSTLVDQQPDRRMYRIFAELRPQADLRRFPFDNQAIDIVLEDRQLEAGDLTFVADQRHSGLDDDVMLVGWSIAGWSASTAIHRHDVLDETYSRYRFRIDATKPAWNGFLKTLMPIVFIVLIVICSFIMDIGKTDDRLSTATAGLIGAVMIHLTISNQIPPVAYLTLADQFMLVVYAFLTLTLAYNFWLLELVQRGREARARAIHQGVRMKVLVGGPVVFALILWAMSRF